MNRLVLFSLVAMYIQLKRMIGPRWYSAIRANYRANNYRAAGFLVTRQVYECAVGFRPDRFQLHKVGYEWVKVEGGPQTQDGVFGVQLVTLDQLTFQGLKVTDQASAGLGTRRNTLSG